MLEGLEGKTNARIVSVSAGEVELGHAGPKG